MPRRIADTREIAELVPMAQLLAELGFAVSERTRRAPCLLHGGSNPTAFSWTEAGLWRCHSCGKGGDKITLIRAVRNCGFREAVEFLAALAGVEFRLRRASGPEIVQARRRRARAEQAAWRVADDIGMLRRYYVDCLHRTERLQSRTDGRMHCVRTDADREAIWENLARLAPVSTFFLAAWQFISDAPPDALVRFALASPAERRALTLGGDEVENAIAA